MHGWHGVTLVRLPSDFPSFAEMLCMHEMTLAPTSMETLMQAAQRGDQQAYAQLLDATARLLRPFLAKRINQPSEVEDVLQEILLSIHKARHTYDGQRPYKPWMYAIARFRLNDYLRSHYSDRLTHALELDEALDVATTDVTESAFTYESIKGAIDALPGKQPAILQRLHGQGQTAKEVAAAMNMTETAVKVAAHRAYKILRKTLAHER